MSVQQQQFLLSIDETTERVPKKKKREFLSAPLSGTPLFPQTFHFYLRVSCFPPRPPLSFPFASLSSSPNFLFLHPFSTTFAYPAGAITTAGNKKVTEVYDRLMQTAGKKIHKTIIDAGLQSTRLPKRDPLYRSGVWCHLFKCTRDFEEFFED